MSDDAYPDIKEVTVELPDRIDDAEGVVLKWRRRGDLLEGLVSRDQDGRVVTEWIPALLLTPARREQQHSSRVPTS